MIVAIWFSVSGRAAEQHANRGRESDQRERCTHCDLHHDPSAKRTPTSKIPLRRTPTPPYGAMEPPRMDQLAMTSALSAVGSNRSSLSGRRERSSCQSPIRRDERHLPAARGDD